MKCQRKRACHFLWLLRLIVVLLVCGKSLTAAGGDWKWQNPLIQGNTLNAIWGSSGNDVFAVGDFGTILHYNGSAWSVMTGRLFLPLLLRN